MPEDVQIALRIIGIVAVLVGALAMVVLILRLSHAAGDDPMERAELGLAFVALPIPDNGSLLMCGCLQGVPARFQIMCGPGVGGLLCVTCARSEFLNWALRQGFGDDRVPVFQVVAAGEKK